MSSWTDDPRLLTAFTPYIQQLPVEAMVSVGMEKQRRYDEGVQKIQASIDRVAGLDVVRDVDRNYLQSKLNELGKRLRTVAAGDFSNYQLVSSVSGMAGNVAKDKNIINAVASTARYRKEMERLQSAQKGGKSSVNREYDFSREVSNWMNDPNVGSSFSGQFREHIDVNKKILDVIQTLHPNLKVYDMPYTTTTNPDGTINYQGIADFMRRHGEKTVDEGMIKTAVNSMLTADDLDELASQGRYIYRGYDKDDLLKKAAGDYESSKRQYQEKLDELNRRLLTATDVKDQEYLNTSIDYYKSMLGEKGKPGELYNMHQSIVDAINKDVDGARASLYTRNWLDQVANGFAYKEIDDKVLANPARAEMWKKLEYDLDVMREKNRHEEALKGGKGKGEGEEGVESPYWKRSGDEATQNLESLSNWAAFNKDLADRNKEILREVSNRLSTPGAKLSDNDILLMMEEYKKNPAMAIDGYIQELFDKYDSNAKFITTNEEVLRIYRDNAYKKVTGGVTAQENLNRHLRGLSDLNITLPNGQMLSFSSKEIYDFLSKEKFSQVGTGMTVTSIYSIDDSQLTERERALKEVIASRYKPSSLTTAAGLTGNQEIDNYIRRVRDVIDSTVAVEREVNKIVADDMAHITGGFAKQQSPIMFKDSNQEGRFISAISAVADADMRQKSGDKGYDPKAVIRMLSGDSVKDLTFNVIRKGERYFVRIMDVKNPKDEQTIPVDEDFIIKNEALGEAYLTPNINIGEVLLRNNKSTNIFKDYDHAFYGSGRFGTYDRGEGKQTVTLPVVADLNEGGGKLYPVLKLKKKDGTYITYVHKDSTDLVEFESYLRNLTDELIYKLFETIDPDIRKKVK